MTRNFARQRSTGSDKSFLLDFDVKRMSSIVISVTSGRLFRGMKVDHKKRRGEGFKSGWGKGVRLSLVGCRQASTDKLEFSVSCSVLEGGVRGLDGFVSW